jgi:hypothetical protein
MTALSTRIRGGIDTIGKLREEAKQRVDRFEAKARERLEGLKSELLARRAQVKSRVSQQVHEQVVVPLHKVLDLPTHGEIAEVSAKVDQLQVRVDELLHADRARAQADSARADAALNGTEAPTHPGRTRSKR